MARAFSGHDKNVGRKNGQRKPPFVRHCHIYSSQIIHFEDFPGRLEASQYHFKIKSITSPRSLTVQWLTISELAGGSQLSIEVLLANDHSGTDVVGEGNRL
jgi:hypothetical protein